MHAIFSEFALLLMMSALAGVFPMRLHQPVIITYIVIGIVAGSVVIGIVLTKHVLAESQCDVLVVCDANRTQDETL